jgi:hypothetical protein
VIINIRGPRIGLREVGFDELELVLGARCQFVQRRRPSFVLQIAYGAANTPAFILKKLDAVGGQEARSTGDEHESRITWSRIGA